jgi:pyridoxamine 5'-phosphate oxidase
MDISNIRREYTLAGLRRADLEPDPVAQFRKWFHQARQAEKEEDPMDVNAATLATADKTGRPSARVVLLKDLDERGFVFFTNYESRKGNELAGNPRAALVFYWRKQERQVCVAGDVERISAGESEAYFKTRPKASRLATWVSRHQSEVIEGRAVLEERFHQLEKQYPGEDVPMPPYWGGYVLAPIRIEFWQGRPGRLHDRFCYTRQPDKTWRIERLSP